MNPHTTYLINAFAWMVVWAGLGLVARPLINRISKGRPDQ